MMKIIVAVGVILSLIIGYASFFTSTDMDSFIREDMGIVKSKTYEKPSKTTTLMMAGKAWVPITTDKPAKYRLDVSFNGYKKSFDVKENLYNKYTVEEKIPIMIYKRERVLRKKVIEIGEIFHLKE